MLGMFPAAVASDLSGYTLYRTIKAVRTADWPRHESWESGPGHTGRGTVVIPVDTPEHRRMAHEIIASYCDSFEITREEPYEAGTRLYFEERSTAHAISNPSR